MITTTDTANIMYTVCKQFGMPVYQSQNIPIEDVSTEGRIVIHVKEQTAENIWRKGFVEVNFFVPDTPNGKADLITLNEIERMATRSLRGTGAMDGTAYHYNVTSTYVLENSDLKAHYVNAKVLFRSMNVIE